MTQITFSVFIFVIGSPPLGNGLTARRLAGPRIRSRFAIYTGFAFELYPGKLRGSKQARKSFLEPWKLNAESSEPSDKDFLYWDASTRRRVV